jgi:hypothetical protein
MAIFAGKCPANSRRIMTSRERVLTTLWHQQPDRVPRDFWAEPENVLAVYQAS